MTGRVEDVLTVSMILVLEIFSFHEVEEVFGWPAVTVEMTEPGGEIPAKVARYSPASVLIVKRYEGTVKSLLKSVLG